MRKGYYLFHRRATGHTPYAYQAALAEVGLPDLLRVPTGCGKTAAAVLPWLYRRLAHPDPRVRRDTPPRLALTLPMRTLVEQTERAVEGWLSNLGLSDTVSVVLMMGGNGPVDREWRREPHRECILIGTLDQLLSRALLRGYGTNRFSWPVDFGLLHNGVQWVFDEVQLMGPALATSRQLEGFRRRYGTLRPSASMWMSATVDMRLLATVDAPPVEKEVGLEEADETGLLATRLNARRTVRAAAAHGRRSDLAGLLVERHTPGTLTLAVVNTVDRAQALAADVRAQTAVPTVLLHSRYRPVERRRHLEVALAPVGPDGLIVVATQVLECGVDIDARVLLTEAASWPSIVQRAGRCNREGTTRDAEVWWTEPPSASPYDPRDVAATVEELCSLEGRSLTTAELSGRAVATAPTVVPVLRSRDLHALFDTAPDLAGNDVDVGRFLRDSDDLDVQIGWLLLHDQPPADGTQPPPVSHLCPVPVGDMREAVQKGRIVYRHDSMSGTWKPCGRRDVHPGQILLADSAAGGYSAEVGWDPASRHPVPPAQQEDAPAPGPEGRLEESMSDDVASFDQPAWTPLRQHLADVEMEAAELGSSLPEGLRETLRIAGGLHDVGKAHRAFQETLLRTADPAERAALQREVDEGRPWAKSACSYRTRHEPPHFRHELATALALMGKGALVLSGCDDPDLVTYLAAAHHGRVRLGVRSMPDEATGRILGIADGDVVPAVPLAGGTFPACRLDTTLLGLGESDGRPSWAARALELLERDDLGPFRLAYLEALLRIADWRASRSPGRASL
jgi:CRISPR-associated endonuclease/helicase Cas3